MSEASTSPAEHNSLSRDKIWLIEQKSICHRKFQLFHMDQAAKLVAPHRPHRLFREFVLCFDSLFGARMAGLNPAHCFSLNRGPGWYQKRQKVLRSHLSAKLEGHPFLG